MNKIKMWAKIFHITFGVFFTVCLILMKEYNYAKVSGFLSILVIIDDIKNWNK